jgi:gliding motility-associated-like protein
MRCILKGGVMFQLFSIKKILILIFCSITQYQLLSQTTCNGILGDPLINITFGAGTNPGPPLLATTSSYSYVGTDCPADGNYTVRNNSLSCFFGDWHNIEQDHTGNANGYFLLINAAARPNDFYLDTIHNLCANTTYQFAAWLLNIDLPTSCINGGARSNITFRIEKTNGTLLKSFSTNDIEPTNQPLWQQYAFLFSTTETSLVLRMSNANAGGCGGDFAVDDITFRPCIADPKSFITTNNTANVKVFHCQSSDTTFTFTSKFNNIYTNVGYLWQSSVDSGKSWVNIPGANKAFYSQSFTATNNNSLFLYRSRVGETSNLGFDKCTVVSNIDSVLNAPEPIPISTSNAPVCEGNVLVLSSSGGSKYNWTGVSGFVDTGKTILIDSIKTSNSGTYIVKVTSEFGCSALDSVTVIINSNPKAFAGNDTSICEGKIVQLIGSGLGTYNWLPANTLSNALVAKPYAKPISTTRYTLIVTNNFNCTDTASVMVTVLKIPTANAGADKQVLQGYSVKLDGLVSGSNISHYWTPNLFINNSLLVQPLVSPVTNTVYTLHVVSNSGCGIASDDVMLTVLKKIEIPNIFSPNNDGINDTWVLKNLETYHIGEMTIFNRNGQKVYVSRSYNTPWNGFYNGSPLPLGTYYYLIQLKNPESMLQGFITIVR